jgi:hypothetical protein
MMPHIVARIEHLGHPASDAVWAQGHHRRLRGQMDHFWVADNPGVVGKPFAVNEDQASAVTFSSFVAQQKWDRHSFWGLGIRFL